MARHSSFDFPNHRKILQAGPLLPVPFRPWSHKSPNYNADGIGPTKPNPTQPNPTQPNTGGGWSRIVRLIAATRTPAKSWSGESYSDPHVNGGYAADCAHVPFPKDRKSRAFCLGHKERRLYLCTFECANYLLASNPLHLPLSSSLFLPDSEFGSTKE